MMQYKVVRVVIHPVEKLCTALDYGNTLSPRQSCCKESGNFNILLFAEAVRNGYGIVLNEAGPVILKEFFFQ